MFLPDRYDSSSVLGNDTKNRINESDYFVVFLNTGRLTPIVEQEIEYAFNTFQDKSRIPVIFDSTKPTKIKSNRSFTQIGLDPSKDTTENSTHRILGQIEIKENKKNTENGLLALLGIGLGLWALSAIFDGN